MSDIAQQEAFAIELQSFVKTALGERIISEIESIILSNTMTGDQTSNEHALRSHDVANGARQALSVILTPIRDLENGRYEELKKMEKDMEQ